jgi:uncharacterized protein (DUF983 family)
MLHAKEAVVSTEQNERDIWLGFKRGLTGRCPACGQAAMFSSYLKVVPECPSCGHVLSQYRADDGPAYFTILIIGHLLIGPLLFIQAIRTAPVEIVSAILVGTIVVAALVLLPLVKGAFVGVQWGVRDRSGAS